VPAWRPSTLSAGGGALLLAAAALMLVVRVPSAFDSFGSARHAAAGRNQLGGALATADAVGLNDAFVSAAITDIPRTGRFVVAVASNEPTVEVKDDVSATTFSAAVPFFEDYLLPRRVEFTPARGDYVVCFYCDASWNARTHWFPGTFSGGRIGRLVR